MKLLIVLSAVAACCLARPSLLHAPLALAAAPVIAAPFHISSQYHAQDVLGQYSYGYAEPLSAKSESRSWDGVTRGGYAYLDANGQVQSVQYTADAANGFRVSASNLPVAPDSKPQEPVAPVQDTEEVAKAKAEHLAAVEEAKKREEAAATEEVKEKTEDSESEAHDEGVEAVSEEAESSGDSSSGSSAGDAGASVSVSVPASTVSVSAPVVSTYVQQPVSYYSYAALAPAVHYKAVVPAVHAYGYAPLVYSGLPLNAHLKAFAASTIIH